MMHDTILTAGLLAWFLAARNAWRASGDLKEARRLRDENVKALTDGRTLAAAMLEAFSLWNYGARDEALDVIRKAGIKIEVR